MWKCTYIETSAKRNLNIESIFEVKRTGEMQIIGKQELRKYFFQEILELEQQRALYLQSEEDKVTTLFLYNISRHGLHRNYFQDKKKKKNCVLL